MAALDGSGGLQRQQMQAAMLAMAGGAPNMPGMAGDAMAMPQFDPVMAQTYVQMFQYFQGLQNSALSGSGIAMPGMPGMPGMPPMPVPGMPPYAPSLPTSPAINVSVQGMKFQYQLTEDDLQKVFSRYGTVKGIRIDEGGSSATIAFFSVQDAQSAMNDLNGKVLNGLDGTLRISWAGGLPQLPPAPPPYPGMAGFPQPGGVPGVPGWGFNPSLQSAPAWHMGVPDMSRLRGDEAFRSAEPGPKGDGNREKQHMKGVRKFTCRFLIGIENDKDFQVARRIIGSKGTNMKKIVKASDAKLRLRGVGSGYMEGGGQKESTEPLQLCVSCINEEGYNVAVKWVHELLNRVYDEYRKFCSEHGKPIPDLKINLSENQLVYSSRSQALTGGAPFDREDWDDIDKKGKTGPKKRDPALEDGFDRGEPLPHAPPSEEIERYIDERNEARRANNFGEADRIRQLLHSRGVALMDEPGGRGRGTEVTTWRYWRD